MEELSIYDLIEAFTADIETDWFIDCYDIHLKMALISLLSSHNIRYYEDNNNKELIVKVDFKNHNAISLKHNDSITIKYNLLYDYVRLTNDIRDMILKYPIVLTKQEFLESEQKTGNSKYSPESFKTETEYHSEEEKEKWIDALREKGFDEEYISNRLAEYENTLTILVNEHVYGSSVFLDTHIYTGKYKNILNLFQLSKAIEKYIQKNELEYNSNMSLLNSEIENLDGLKTFIGKLGYQYLLDTNKIEFIDNNDNNIFSWEVVNINIL